MRVIFVIIKHIKVVNSYEIGYIIFYFAIFYKGLIRLTYIFGVSQLFECLEAFFSKENFAVGSDSLMSNMFIKIAWSVLQIWRILCTNRGC